MMHESLIPKRSKSLTLIKPESLIPERFKSLIPMMSESLTSARSKLLMPRRSESLIPMMSESLTLIAIDCLVAPSGFDFFCI